MKKLLFILAAVVLAAGCSDKDEYSPAETSTPTFTSMTYSTALDVDRQTTNRKEIYHINGNYIKLSIEYIESDDYYTLRADKWTAAGDKASDKILDCEIAQLEGEYASVTSVNLKNVIDNDELDFQPSAILPEAEVQDEEKDNVWTSESHPAYVVRFVDPASGLNIHFLVHVYMITKTKSVEEEVIPSDEPFGEDKVEEVTYYSLKADLSYKAFNSHGWIN